MRRHLPRLGRALAPLSLLVPALALGCECASMPLLSRLGNSDAVFLGEVLAHRPQASLEFRVIEAYKNVETPSVIIQTGAKSLCDYFFKPSETRVGDRYLVFMSTGADGNRINRCFGTAPAAAVQEEIVILRGWRGM